jgi:superfamily II DNA or RNA helicase
MAHPDAPGIAAGDGWVIADAAAVVCRMLSLRFGTPRPSAHASPVQRQRHPELALFQQHALERIRTIIAMRGGALLCDSVGLGKTHVARALIRVALAERRPVLVCAPAQLGRHWRRYLRGMRGWSWLSHTALSRGRAWRPRGARPLIVVDEAHAFRNPATRRYRTLALLCADADVLMMTATPVNNSLADFQHLVRLFARDDAFSDVGVPGLAVATDTALRGGDAGGIRRVAEAVVVRRTREFVRRRYGTTMHDADGTILRFPTSAPVQLVRYDLDSAYHGTVDFIGEALLGLTFPVHAMNAMSPRPSATRAPATGPSTTRPSPAFPSQTLPSQNRGTAAELMRLSLLKRLESSTAAFEASLRRQAGMLQLFINAARRGYLVDAHDHRTLFREVDGAMQLPLEGVALRRWPARHDRDVMVSRGEGDLDAIRAMLRTVPAPAADPKVQRLCALLSDSQVREHPVLIFTEFRDTAVALWKALSPAGGVALIHGRDARLGLGRASRSRVVERFAPRANGLPPVRPHERVRVLIATDVLAEGLNLQDARTVVSYDVPWNPVRMAQRFGRIDRLGSPHASIATYAFQPDRQLDTLLGLVRRVRHKLRAIRVVGGDAPRLVGGGNPRLAGRDASRLVGADSRRGVARRQAAGPFRNGDLFWERIEALRLEYHDRCPDGGSDHGSAPIAAAIHWPRPEPGAVCCFSSGTTTWFVLMQDGRPPRVAHSDIDDLLLDALAATASASALPDPGWLRDAAELARRAVQRHTAARGGATFAPENRRAAAAVHRWIAARPGGPSPGEAALADRLLAGIADTKKVADSVQLGAIVRGRLTDDETVRRLLGLYTDSPGRTPHIAPIKPPGPPQLRAVLALVPSLTPCLPTG